MSKKQFLKAIEHARSGRIEDAVALLLLLERGFVIRRIEHYKRQPDHREAAFRLQTAFLSASPGSSASSRAAETPAPFEALSFDPAAGDAERIALFDLREDTPAAMDLSRARLAPSIVARRSVELDFSHIELCTQSWLHALLFEPMRLAWALRVPIHAINADPAVREGLRFLEAYALGG